MWRDPEFDPKLRAVYYARVIEIPTPRWTAYDAKRLGAKVPKEAPMITQERAYTSPIWYTPVKRVLLAALVAVAPTAMACGFHDDVSLQRGLLNWAYPDSLHVRSGRVARAAGGPHGARGAAVPQGRVPAEGHAAAPRANASLVLLTPMLWTRYGPKACACMPKVRRRATPWW